jgi:hypothetical protein
VPFVPPGFVDLRARFCDSSKRRPQLSPGAEHAQRPFSPSCCGGLPLYLEKTAVPFPSVFPKKEGRGNEGRPSGKEANSLEDVQKDSESIRKTRRNRRSKEGKEGKSEELRGREGEKRGKRRKKKEKRKRKHPKSDTFLSSESPPFLKSDKTESGRRKREREGEKRRGKGAKGCRREKGRRTEPSHSSRCTGRLSCPMRALPGRDRGRGRPARGRDRDLRGPDRPPPATRRSSRARETSREAADGPWGARANRPRKIPRGIAIIRRSTESAGTLPASRFLNSKSCRLLPARLLPLRILLC